jgi:hypothetical protein
MKGSSEKQRRRTDLYDARRSANEADDARTRKAMDARFEAVRRWIGDDDDAACRGID